MILLSLNPGLVIDFLRCGLYSRNYTAISGFTETIEEHFLEEISLVWLLADPPTPRAHTVMAILYIGMMTVGFLGNAFVLFMFCKYAKLCKLRVQRTESYSPSASLSLVRRCRSLRTPANNFVMNLAISDWLMMTKIPIIIHNSLHNGPALGDWGGCCSLKLKFIAN